MGSSSGVGMLFVWVLGCSFFNLSTEDEPMPVQAPAVPKIEEAYVQASLLRLRNHPQQDAGSWSPLGINTRLRVLERQGDWVRVIAADGRTGWVAAEYLASERLTLDEVRGQITSADTEQDRVVWWQRAAALAPSDREVLTGLANAYRAVGKIPEAEQVEALRDEDVNRFDRWFPSDRTEVDAITGELAKVGSAEALVGVWKRARDVTARMAEPLGAGFDGQQFTGGDPRMMLFERMPWADLTLYAEGTVPALELSPATWAAAALRTPEPEDDAFFRLLATAYENASARGWTAWESRTWDYGGCSPFGDGNELHLRVLEQTDALASFAPVAEPVAEVRADVLADIEKPAPDEFPYCRESGDPTPTEALEAEAKHILEKVRLTEDERRRVQARVDGHFGRS